MEASEPVIQFEQNQGLFFQFTVVFLITGQLLILWIGGRGAYVKLAGTTGEQTSLLNVVIYCTYIFSILSDVVFSKGFKEVCYKPDWRGDTCT